LVPIAFATFLSLNTASRELLLAGQDKFSWRATLDRGPRRFLDGLHAGATESRTLVPKGSHGQAA